VLAFARATRRKHIQSRDSARPATRSTFASIATRLPPLLPEPRPAARILQDFSQPRAGGGSTESRRGSTPSPAPVVMEVPVSSSASAVIASEARAAIRTDEDLRATRTSCAMCPAVFATELGDEREQEDDRRFRRGRALSRRLRSVRFSSSRVEAPRASRWGGRSGVVGRVSHEHGTSGARRQIDGGLQGLSRLRGGGLHEPGVRCMRALPCRASLSHPYRGTASDGLPLLPLVCPARRPHLSRLPR